MQPAIEFENCIEFLERHVLKFQEKLEKEKPKYVCNYCGKLLYPSDANFFDIAVEKKSKVCRFEHISLHNLTNGTNKRSFCHTCLANVKKNEFVDMFIDCGEIPEEIKALKSYSEYGRLSLCGLYCNTMQPTKYSYWHMCGQMNVYSKKKRKYSGNVWFDSG